MTRRYWVAAGVLQSAQAGRGYVDVCRPDTGAWVRLGLREGELLVSLTGVSCGELQIRFRDQFTPAELSAALERFETLGLLTDSDGVGVVGPAIMPSPVTSAAAGAGGVVAIGVIFAACASVPLLVRAVSWQSVLLGKPALLDILGLTVMTAGLHEGGHAAAAMLVGRGRLRCQLRWGWLAVLPVLRLRLRGFWGLSKVRRMVVAGAGSLMHLVLAALCVDVWMISLAMTGAGPMVLLWYAALNVVLAGVNVLPLYPLDGYWLLVLALDRPWLWRESRPYRVLSSVALVSIAALGAAGVAVPALRGR
ncbi:MAG TPA: M50 family metallopeptidase [bacterium]|jgi:hypothetical protein|nr:M50 family metallopeptidase [bacterium]